MYFGIKGFYKTPNTEIDLTVKNIFLKVDKNKQFKLKKKLLLLIFPPIFYILLQMQEILLKNNFLLIYKIQPHLIFSF